MSSYYYPGWAQGMGWVMAIAPLMLIPGWALFVYCKNGGFEVSTRFSLFLLFCNNGVCGPLMEHVLTIQKRSLYS